MLQFIEDQGAWPAQSRLLFFIGGCDDVDGPIGSYGKRMRSLFVKLVRQSTSLSTDGSDDIYVHCIGDKHLPFQVCLLLCLRKPSFQSCAGPLFFAGTRQPSTQHAAIIILHHTASGHSII